MHNHTPSLSDKVRRGIKMMALLAVAFTLATTPACSRKTGCPAEDVGVQTDKQGNIKLGKTKSGLLPPKGKKRKKSR